MDRAAARKRTKHRRRRHRHDEQQEVTPRAPGLASLQQSVGNRAVQRMLAEEQAMHLMAQQQQKEAAIEKQVNPEEAETMGDLLGTKEADEQTDKPERELLSGEHWVKKFPASDQLADLESAFGQSVTKFINAIEKGGASIEILSTQWPPERAYMMHFAWLIANDEIHPRQVPPIEEIDFDTDVSTTLEVVWWHGNLEDSQKAAEEMLEAFGIDELEEPPVLASRHVSGEAIDMRISWSGSLTLVGPGEEEITIESGPNDETNEELIGIAAMFGVFHYEDPDEDAVHWSVDGA
ncbi:MAG: hypothetical protein Kow0031_29360 [Anaerolineae bacterium]